MRPYGRVCVSWRRSAAGALSEYRRLGYLLAREGMTPNHKKLRRIYREENLRVRRRGGRKRALGTRAPMVLPDGPNQRLVAGLRLRHADVQPAVPYPVRGRRLQPGMPRRC